MRITISKRDTRLFTRSRWFKVKKGILALTEKDQLNVYDLTPADVRSLRAGISRWQKTEFPRGVTVHEKKRVTIIQLRMADPTEPRMEVRKK